MFCPAAIIKKLVGYSCLSEWLEMSKNAQNITGYSMEINMLIISGKSPAIKLKVVSQHLKIQYALFYVYECEKWFLSLGGEDMLKEFKKCWK